MSVLKPVQKRSKTSEATPSTLVRTQGGDLTEFQREEKDLLTSSTQATTQTPTQTTNQNPTHPKGHKVRKLNEVWQTMDSQKFIRLSDTLTLMDVWFQPISCIPATKGPYADVTMKQVVFGPHLKERTVVTRMSNDDLAKLLYLCDKFQWNMQGLMEYTFEEWLNDKTALCVKAKGLDEGTNRAKMCNFIITEDREFTFYPRAMKRNFGIFFRKTCYHSYKDEEKKTKINNPSMIKCCSQGGKFEYMLEARIFPLPISWTESISDSDDEEVPASQLL